MASLSYMFKPKGASASDPENTDIGGYDVGHFPSGAIPVGQQPQAFAISDSSAFNGLRGIAKMSYPFDPNPMTDTPNDATTLADKFNNSDLSDMSSLANGTTSIKSTASLAPKIVSEITSKSFDSFDWSLDPYNDGKDQVPSDVPMVQVKSITDAFMKANSRQGVDDVPLTPFHKTYPNFGNGHVDYGFSEPGDEANSQDIIKAYHAILPQGQLAGTKSELMPVFSGINQAAVEQRPILQSLGKQKNTLYLGGFSELPDDLTIDPREALAAGQNAPADLVQTGGELVSALNILGYSGADGLHTGNPYGKHLANSKTLKPTDTHIPMGFYNSSNESSFKNPYDLTMENTMFS